MFVFNYLLKKIIANRKIINPLQVQKIHCRTKASFSASFTVEAAFILPMVVYACTAFLYLMVIFNLQIDLQKALIETARDTARYAYTYQQAGCLLPSEEESLRERDEPGLSDVLYHGFSNIYAIRKIKEIVGEERLAGSCIRGGCEGLSLLSENIIDSFDMVDLVLRYYVDIPFLPGKHFGFLCVQRVRIKAWTGYERGVKTEDNKETEEEQVYITETGSVYHTNKNCTHLNLSIKQAGEAELVFLRNNGGGKYHTCEKCIKSSTDGMGIQTFYITSNGSRYHSSLECQGLKRSVKQIPLSEVGEKKLCSRCAGSS